MELEAQADPVHPGPAGSAPLWEVQVFPALRPGLLGRLTSTRRQRPYRGSYLCDCLPFPHSL